MAADQGPPNSTPSNGPLPRLAGDKPRTGCPALYASTFDNVNAIVALVRLTGRCFADLLFD